MEAFVYCWTNHTTKRLYVGYHKGSITDGYICSSLSKEFWDDFNNPEMKWSRQIVAEGTAAECLVLEKEILKALDLNEHYNNGIIGVEMTDEVKQKISNTKKGTIPWNKDKPMTEEQKQKLSAIKKSKPSPNKGRKMSEEQKRKISETMKARGVKPNQDAIKKSAEKRKGVPRSEEAKAKMRKPKRPFSEETKKRMSEAAKKRWAK